MRPACLPLLLVAAVLAGGRVGPLAAQPTYRLDVKKELNPRAALALAGGQVIRGQVTDDPGFRLQFQFSKDGKPVKAVEARGSDRVTPDLPGPGTYTVVLELFHPGYKGGNDLKGKFLAISDTLTFRFEPGKPLAPVAPKP